MQAESFRPGLVSDSSETVCPGASPPHATCVLPWGTAAAAGARAEGRRPVVRHPTCVTAAAHGTADWAVADAAPGGPPPGRKRRCEASAATAARGLKKKLALPPVRTAAAGQGTQAVTPLASAADAAASAKQGAGGCGGGGEQPGAAKRQPSRSARRKKAKRALRRAGALPYTPGAPGFPHPRRELCGLAVVCDGLQLLHNLPLLHSPLPPACAT
jgi:hypothetical protein